MANKLLSVGLVLFICMGLGLNGRGQGPMDGADSIFLRKLADVVLTDGKAYEDLRVLTKKVGARLSGL